MEALAVVSCFAHCLPPCQLVVSTNLFSIAVGHMLIILGIEVLKIRWNLSVTEKWAPVKFLPSTIFQDTLVSLQKVPKSTKLIQEALCKCLTQAQTIFYMMSKHLLCTPIPQSWHSSSPPSHHNLANPANHKVFIYLHTSLGKKENGNNQILLVVGGEGGEEKRPAMNFIGPQYSLGWPVMSLPKARQKGRLDIGEESFCVYLFTQLVQTKLVSCICVYKLFPLLSFSFSHLWNGVNNT